jgi:hypothetical protein
LLWILLTGAQSLDGSYKLPQNEVDSIKKEIIGLMMSVPPNIQAQLGEAVSVIADSDFWERWTTLMDVSHLKHNEGRSGVLN